MTDDEVGLSAEYSHPRPRKCSLCDAKHFVHGLCQKHHSRVRRHGNPHTVIADEDRRHVLLSFEKARKIRALRAAGHPVKDIADDFDVCASTISKVVQGVSWRTGSR